MLGTDLLIAARNLAQHRRRTVSLGAAIAGVTALLVLLNGLTNGIEDSMLHSATTLVTGHVNVGGFYKVRTGQVAPFLTDYDRVLARVRDAPGVELAVVRGRGWAKAVSATGSIDLVLGGIDVGEEPGLRRVLEIVEGSLDALARPNTILLFAEQAKRLEVSTGDDLTLSAPTGRGVHNTADVRVGAVASDVGLLSSFTAFIPSATLRELYQLRPNTTGAVHLYLADPGRAATVAAELRARLAAGGWDVLEPDASPYWRKLFDKLRSQDWMGQKVDVSTWEDEMAFAMTYIDGLSALSGLLIAILLVIVVVGIMNTMWIAIRERTREIGTLRAIGMQRRRVAWLFLLEAALLGALATGLGAVAGTLVALGIDALAIEVPEDVQVFLMSRSLSLSVHAREVLIEVSIVTLVTTLTALLPAIRAARLRPITAMHHIG